MEFPSTRPYSLLIGFYRTLKVFMSSLFSTSSVLQHMNTLSVYFHFNQPTYLFWHLNWIRVFRGQPNILLLLFITLGNFGQVHFMLHKPSRRSIFLGPTACQASTVQYVRHPVKLIRYVHDTRCTTGCQAESMWECGERGAVWT